MILYHILSTTRYRFFVYNHQDIEERDRSGIHRKRKHEEDLQRLRGLRLLDDDFMQKVFEDKECTGFLLQIILNRTDLKVLRVNG